MQDVPAYAARAGLSFRCYYDDSPARLEPATTLRVNYEGFVFCSGACRERFEAAIARDCGLLTDPVSRRRFHPRPGARPWVHAGVPWYFERTANEVAFRARPERWEKPGWRM